MAFVNKVENKIQNIVRVTAVYTAFHNINDADFYFTGEAHDFWEVVYIVGGKAIVTADSHIYNLEKGDIIFHKPMEFHKLASNSSEKLDVIIFSFSATGKMSYFENGLFKVSPEQQKLILNMPGLLDKSKENAIYAH